MLISTRGRYALRIMIDLAEHMNGSFIPTKDIAERQEISLKYMEKIMTMLSKSGLVEGAHGKGGGYRLYRAPDEYKVGDILRVTEGSLSPVSCLESGAEPCSRISQCKTLPMWKKLDSLINGFLDSITLADLMANSTADDYVI